MSKKILDCCNHFSLGPLPLQRKDILQKSSCEDEFQSFQGKCDPTALAQIMLLINHLLTGSDVASCERHPKAKALLTLPGVSGHTMTLKRPCTHTHTHTLGGFGEMCAHHSQAVSTRTKTASTYIRENTSSVCSSSSRPIGGAESHQKREKEKKVERSI